MLKSIVYTGFDTRPDLRARLEHMIPDLANEVGRWGNRVDVVFELRHASADKQFVWLTLSLTLPHVAGENSAVVAFADIEDASEFRKWVRGIWSGVLDKLLEQRAEQRERKMAESFGG